MAQRFRQGAKFGHKRNQVSDPNNENVSDSCHLIGAMEQLGISGYQGPALLPVEAYSVQINVVDKPSTIPVE